MKKKYKFILYILPTFLFFTGCGLNVSPESIIRPPKPTKDFLYSEVSEDGTNIESLCRKFLVKGERLLYRSEFNDRETVIKGDLDSDDIDEIVFLYAVDETNVKGFKILKRYGENFEIIYDKALEGCNKINLRIINLYKDKKSVFVTSLISPKAGFETFGITLVNGNFTYKYLGHWNSFEILREASQDKSFVFAGGRNEASTLMDYYVVDFDGVKFSYDKEFSSSYYKELIGYYSKRYDHFNGDEVISLEGINLFYLIKAKINCGLIDEAYAMIRENKNVKSVNKNEGYPSYCYPLLEARILRLKNKLEESEKVLKDEINSLEYKLGIWIYSDDTNFLEMHYYREKLYLELSNVCKAKGDKEGEKSYKEKCKKILDDISKFDFYGSGIFQKNEVIKELDYRELQI